MASSINGNRRMLRVAVAAAALAVAACFGAAVTLAGTPPAAEQAALAD